MDLIEQPSIVIDEKGKMQSFFTRGTLKVRNFTGSNSWICLTVDSSLLKHFGIESCKPMTCSFFVFHSLSSYKGEGVPSENISEKFLLHPCVKESKVSPSGDFSVEFSCSEAEFSLLQYSFPTGNPVENISLPLLFQYGNHQWGPGNDYLELFFHFSSQLPSEISLENSSVEFLIPAPFHSHVQEISCDLGLPSISSQSSKNSFVSSMVLAKSLVHGMWDSTRKFYKISLPLLVGQSFLPVKIRIYVNKDLVSPQNFLGIFHPNLDPQLVAPSFGLQITYEISSEFGT